MAMLNLNVNTNPSDAESTSAQKEEQLQSFPLQIQDSGSSISSAVNSAEENSSNYSSPFIFDILTKETDGLESNATERDSEENTAAEAEIVTRNLFPVTADRGGRESEMKLEWWGKAPSFAEPDYGQAAPRTLQHKQPQVRKGRRGPRSRSSQYRGVTFYRRTGRWESHIWDCGKQVYLGGFDTSQAAARAYDRAAIQFRGVDADINFSLSDYEEDLKQMRGLSKKEFILILRRQSNGISMGSSKYRALLAHDKCGQMEAPMDPLVGKKFCHKPLINCDDREVETNFKPSTSKREIIVNSTRGGIIHNLDLSLGISPSSKRLNKSDSGAGFSFGYTTCGIPKGGGTMEKAMINSTQTVPSQRFSSLAWLLRSSGSFALGSGPLLSSAASSGFFSSNSTDSSTTLPISTHNNFACISCIGSSTTSTFNFLHCQGQGS